jgi:RNA 3'-terminal phosphate cyclase-like protein
MLAPFSKRSLQLTLRGITTDENDLSVRHLLEPTHLLLRAKFPQVDLFRTVTLPHLQLFGISDGLELRVRIFLLCFVQCSLSR